MIFNTRHYASRLAGARISIARAEAAVAMALTQLRASMEVNTDTIGRVLVDGSLVEFRARLLEDGKVRVGTIFPVK
jgi:thiamine biosynthesis protein ThiC